MPPTRCLKRKRQPTQKVERLSLETIYLTEQAEAVMNSENAQVSPLQKVVSSGAKMSRTTGSQLVEHTSFKVSQFCFRPVAVSGLHLLPFFMGSRSSQVGNRFRGWNCTVRTSQYASSL